jgi:hypothetical protein
MIKRSGKKRRLNERRSWKGEIDSLRTKKEARMKRGKRVSKVRNCECAIDHQPSEYGTDDN